MSVTPYTKSNLNGTNESLKQIFASIKFHFETACEAFFDPFLRVVKAGIVEGEPREAVIGMTESWRLLSVVYIEGVDVIRIVSARTAEKQERKIYEEQ